ERLSNTTAANTGATTAPPNIWRWNGAEAVIVPVVYQTLFAKDVRLLAFSTSGAVLADELVTEGSSPVVTDEGVDFFDCLNPFAPIGALLCPFLVASDPGAYIDGDPSRPFYPLPGVAIRPAFSGRPPSVMATDAIHDKIVYDFSPQTGFTEVHRSQHVQRRFTTPPVVLPGGLGTTLTGTVDGYLTRTTYSPRLQDYVQLSAIGGLGPLTAAPTRLKDGGLVVISRDGVMTVLSGVTVLRHSHLGEGSIASAAASCDHFFVATTDH